MWDRSPIRQFMERINQICKKTLLKKTYECRINLYKFIFINICCFGLNTFLRIHLICESNYKHSNLANYSISSIVFRLEYNVLIQFYNLY